MRILLFSILCGFSAFAFSQNCSVQVEALTGSYEGDCKNKKANGIGTATGKDSYTGEFINGYPEGQGKYIWENGNWYEGKWKKGKRDGHGEMHYIKKDLIDSIVVGFWKNDNYLRRYEVPYIVHNLTANMRKVNVEFNSRDNQIEFAVITIVPSGGIAAAASNFSVTKIDVLEGKYLSKENKGGTSGTPLGISLLILKQVQFPFHAVFHIGTNNNVVEIEFLESGTYKVSTGIN